MSFKFFSYCFKLSKIIAAKFIIFMCFSLISIFTCLFSFFTDQDLNSLSFIIFLVTLIISVVSFINVFIDFRHMTGMDLTKKCSISSDLQDFKTINSVNSKFKFIKVELKNGCIFYSQDLNNILIEKNQIKAKIDTSKYKSLRAELSDNREQYLPFLAQKIIDCNNKGIKFTNDAKLCLSSDVNGECVSFHYGTYYDTYLTNIICGRRMIANTDCKTTV